MITKHDDGEGRGRQDHTKAGVHLADDEPQTLGLSEIARREHIAKAFLLRLVVASDHDEIARGGAVQLVLHLADIAAETLDRFDA